MAGAPGPAVVPRRRTYVRVGALGVAVNLLVAMGIGVIRTAAATAGERHAEGALPTIAMVCAYLAPAAVAGMGLVRARPALLLAAGVLCFPIAILSIATLPIWIAGGCYLASFVAAPRSPRPHFGVDALVVGGFALPVLAGLWLLVTRTAQFEYRTATGSEGGDYFTRGHAVLCIVLVVIDVVIVAALARRTSQAATAAASASV